MSTMMGRGADGGCGTEEKTCPVSRIFPSAVKTPAPALVTEELKEINLGVDLYSQALKALSERLPFDSDEVLVNTNPNLPSGLARLLIKQVDSRRKHKRAHTDAKSSRKGSTEKKSIWGEVEDCSREVILQDIVRLYRFSSCFGSSLVSKNSCFTIPVLGNGPRNHRKVELPYNDNAPAPVPAPPLAPDPAPAVVVEEKVKQGKVVTLDSGACLEGVCNGNSEQGMVIDNEGSGSFAVVEGSDLHLSQSSSPCSSSVEWVLGSRNRVLLTTTRPTKKRKLLGENAGLERLNVAQPCEGNSNLCHVCSVGDTRDQLNQLVVCSSCNVVVHKKCYGVQGEVDKSWMCSSCKHLIDVKGRAVGRNRPCALCPKQGGALKRFRIGTVGSDESAEFAHLFCSQWMPEVYINDTRLMEPLLSVGVKEIRGKLVCNLCKVKLGSCIRCSDGSCRTSFHPICAREAGNKLEIWGKFGCDDIELRAFCAKHSSSIVDSVKSHQNHPVVSDLLATSNQPPVLSVNKIKKLKIGCKNGDKVTFHIGGGESKPKHSEEAVSQKAVLKDANGNLKSGVGDGQELSDVKTLEKGLNEDAKASNLVDLGKVLKKLVDCGKVSLEQLASDVDISADTLAATLTGNHLAPELYCKMFKWLRDHAYMDIDLKDMKAKVRSSIPSKAGTEDADSFDAVGVRDWDISDVVPFKSVPPRLRTVGNIRIFKEGKLMSLWNDEAIVNRDLTGGVRQEHMDEDHDDLHKDSIVDISEKKNIDEVIGLEDSLKEPSPGAEGTLVNPNDHFQADCNGAEEGTFPQSSLLDLDQDLPSNSSLDIVSHCDRNVEPGTEFFVHPYVQKRLVEVQCWVKQGAHSELHGSGRNKRQFSNANAFSTDVMLSVWGDNGERINGVNLGDLSEATKKGVLDLFPEDELEGEIIYFQQKLLSNAVLRKCCTDQLVCQAVRNLPREISAARKRKWDDVLVNQYIYELKEARKQGRKEKRHKEAQAVLTAATAAAAASSRNSSFRKDVDESPHRESQLKLENSRVRGGISLQLVPQARDNSSLASSRAVSDGCSDFFQYTAGSPKEHPKSCDVCRRAESILNPILVCSSCKVVVHLNCYRCAKESIGPWYCELCEESSSSKISTAASCGLCGASKGAFRKSSNGQWVHAVCAEWVFDSTFKRGQVHSVEGMETVTKGNDVCAACQDRYGVCIKCHYGNCQSMFHPYCARSSGYYMYARSIGGGKMQLKACCSKHSKEQKAKAETQRHAAEDLKTAKQYRVELEKLRLLCERIVKREKLKRELVLCDHEILASKLEAVAVSRFVRRPYISHEMSSESATTSLRGDVDGSRSCSEAFEKADDVTVDSALSVKRFIRLPLYIDSDQKTDDSSTSQLLPTPKPFDRVSFSGKKLPIRAVVACPNFPQNGEKTLNSTRFQFNEDGLNE